MKSLAQVFQPLAVTAAVQAACVAAGVLFLCWGLGAPHGTEGAFAAACIGLFWAGLLGPFVYTRVHKDAFWAPPVRGALRCALLGLTAASVCAVYAALTRGPIGAAFVAGLFCGFYAWSAGALGDLLAFFVPPRLASSGAAALAIVLLGTLMYWDALFLPAPERGGPARNASAATALQLNAAAAVSVTLDYDWLHASVLYRNNETAESMAGVRRGGVGGFVLRSGLVALGAVLVAGLLHPLRRRKGIRWNTQRS